MLIFILAPCINSIKELFIIPTNAHNYKITGMLKQLKFPQLLRYVSVHASVRYTVEEGVPSYTVYRTLAHRLVCRHDIDNVINGEHNRTMIVVLAKHEIAP
jgi:hypothetical protein